MSDTRCQIFAPEAPTGQAPALGGTFLDFNINCITFWLLLNAHLKSQIYVQNPWY